MPLENSSPSRTKNTVMLATFTNDSLLDTVIYSIFDKFTVDNEKVFIFYDKEAIEKKILTYNVLMNEQYNTGGGTKQIKRTIRINRKKDSNTLYTINAINRIIELEGGSKTKDYILDWQKYRDMILLYDENDNSVVETKTKLYSILLKTDFQEKGTAFVKKNPQYM